MKRTKSILFKVYELLHKNKKKRVLVKELKKVTKDASYPTYYGRCITYLRNHGYTVINKKGMYKMM